MSAYEIFSSTQPHESSNLDAKLRKFLQRFLPAHLKDKPKEYVHKGKSIRSIRRIRRRYPPPSPQQQKKKKQTKIVTPPPSPKTTEHNQPVVPLEEIEKAIEEEEEEEEDTR